ncbi:BufA1 family periplasmic bufferin-type metallophore [Marinobacterium rhizophilum]|uniref:DUF2282 domain-containing protein n=1 Tax=Marinobacterium rhizophilum TaxID=420402 RepID=A0ABY5HHP3_9GAMM|nr:DUF2282 domain-containing protein [Marinobacterium rhizophilum]UTW11880.1 DUF2282 domain-containing protein [Marinobacterium rhizophilum]
MKASTQLISAAVFALSTAGIISAGTALAEEPQFEKCYGIAAAGKNDCQTATSSCAGTSKHDRQTDAFIAVPQGTCSKIAGATLEAK